MGFKNLNIGKTKDWENPDDWEYLKDVHSWPFLSNQSLAWLNQYALYHQPIGAP